MPLSDAQFRVVRSWVGSGPTDEDLNERFERLADIDQVILESLRAQLSKLLEQPSSFSTPDGLSMSTSENIRALRERIDKFNEVGGTTSFSKGVTRIDRRFPR